jgi:hypothetical protein
VLVIDSFLGFSNLDEMINEKLVHLECMHSLFFLPFFFPILLVLHRYLLALNKKKSKVLNFTGVA